MTKKSINDLTPESAGEYVIDHVIVVDPEANKTWPGHVGVKDGKIEFTGALRLF